MAQTITCAAGRNHHLSRLPVRANLSLRPLHKGAYKKRRPRKKLRGRRPFLCFGKALELFLKFCLKLCNVCGGSLGNVYNNFHVAHVIGKLPAGFEFFYSVDPSTDLNFAIFEYSYGVRHILVLLDLFLRRKGRK